MELTFVVSTPDGVWHKFDVPDVITVGQFKRHISRVLGINMDHQGLFLVDTELHDGMLLREVYTHYRNMGGSSRPYKRAKHSQRKSNAQNRNRNAYHAILRRFVNQFILAVTIQVNDVLERYHRRQASRAAARAESEQSED